MSRTISALLAATAIATIGANAGVAQEARVAAASTDARARAESIVARMTLDEKIALVHGLFPPLTKATPANELIPSAGHIEGNPRLGVPLVRESDASLGVANQVEQRKGDVATALPSSLATAATFEDAVQAPRRARS